MPESYIPLNKLPLGIKAKIRLLTTSGAARRRMLDLGLIKDTIVEPLLKSPSGDPVAYFIRGAVIAFRSEDTAKIFVETI